MAPWCAEHTAPTTSPFPPILVPNSSPPWARSRCAFNGQCLGPGCGSRVLSWDQGAKGCAAEARAKSMTSFPAPDVGQRQEWLCLVPAPLGVPGAFSGSGISELLTAPG